MSTHLGMYFSPFPVMANRERENVETPLCTVHVAKLGLFWSTLAAGKGKTGLWPGIGRVIL